MNEINTSVAYKQVIDGNLTMPDSLKKKVVFQSPKRNYLAEIEEGNKIKRSTSFDRQLQIKQEEGTLQQLWNSVKSSVESSVKSSIGQIDSLKSKGKELLKLPDIKLNTPLDMFEKKKKGDEEIIEPVKLPDENQNTNAPKEAIKEEEENNNQQNKK